MPKIFLPEREKRLQNKIDFNRDWRFCKSHAEWPQDLKTEEQSFEDVVLPHTWNAGDMGVDRNSKPYIGVGWYHKRFRPPTLEHGQRLLIEFEAVAMRSRVWCNGAYIGGRDGGFLGFMLDATETLTGDQNTILVRADNFYNVFSAVPESIDWDRYGGIHRPVWLHVREHAYIDYCGIEIVTPRVTGDIAEVMARTHIYETRQHGVDLFVRHVLLSPDADEVCRAEQRLHTRYCQTSMCEAKLPSIERPKLWSVDQPTLYTLRTEIMEGDRCIDESIDRIGFRYYRFDPEQGFFLNDRPLKLKGANLHHFYPGLGSACPERFYVEDVIAMKRMGCNFMRGSHYPRAKASLDTCDEVGILVLEEQPYWHGSVRAFRGEVAIDNSRRLLHDMIRQHGNHPCIIVWNTVNEIMLAPIHKPGVGHLDPDDPRRAEWEFSPSEYPYVRRAVSVMVETLRNSDPHRSVSIVIGGPWQKNIDAGLTELTDLVALNGGAVNFPKAPFVGPRTGKTYTFVPDYLHEAFPHYSLMMSEGVLNDRPHQRADWEAAAKSWHLNARYWNKIYARSWFCGGAMWCFTDYSANGMLRPHGVVDRFRLPYELFHFYSAMWAARPVLHILGHWDPVNAPEFLDVVVFTNCRGVELSLNGQALGAGVSTAAMFPHIPNPPLIWHEVAYAPGELMARGCWESEIVEDRRRTAGPPAELRVETAPSVIKADGRDASLITVVVCDTAGNRCYQNFGEVTVHVEGTAIEPAESVLEVRGGLARCAVRSTGVAGSATLALSAVGLPTATIRISAEVPHSSIQPSVAGCF